MAEMVCPYCGGDVQAEVWVSFETCPHCGREYSVQNAQAAKSANAGDGIKSLRARFDAALNSGEPDYAAVRTAAEAVLEIIPDDFICTFYAALADYKLNNRAAVYNDFLRRADVSRAPQAEREAVAQAVIANITQDAERAARTFFYSVFGAGGSAYFDKAHARLMAAATEGRGSAQSEELGESESNRAQGDTAPIKQEKKSSAKGLADALQTIRVLADDYDLENGMAEIRAAESEYADNAELKYWEFVFDVCNAYYIDSNAVKTDIVRELPMTAGKAYDSVAYKFNGFLESLPAGGRKLPQLAVGANFLPCATDVEADYNKLTSKRSVIVNKTESDISAIKGASVRTERDRYQRDERIAKAEREKDKALDPVNSELRRLEREIRDNADFFLNYDIKVAQSIIDQSKRDAVYAATEKYVPERMCDELAQGAVDRLGEIIDEPTAAEVTAFAYFAACSPTVFAWSSFKELCELAPDSLRNRLLRIKRFAGEVHDEICAALEREFAEKLYGDIVTRFKFELDLRKEMLISKQTAIAAILPVMRSNYRKRVVLNILLTVLFFVALAGAIIGFAIVGFDLDAIGVFIGIVALPACGLAAVEKKYGGASGATVRDLTRLRGLYAAANVDLEAAKRSADSYLPHEKVIE